MVCLTSCVFRSIRFSGFARPHFGVRREGELYTQAQAGGKGVSAPAQDGHKSGDNGSLGIFPAHMAGTRGRGGSGPAAAAGQARANKPGSDAPDTRRLGGQLAVHHSRPRLTTLQRPPPIRAGDEDGLSGRSSVRALTRTKGMHFFATPLSRRPRPASMNAKGPPPLVGKRAP